MSQIIPQLVFKDLANNVCNISDYDFYRLVDYIKNTKTDFALDILLISFTSCYNNYLEHLNTYETIKIELEKTKKEILNSLSMKCKTLSTLLNCFEMDILTIFNDEIKSITISLLNNDDVVFANNFCLYLSKIDPFFCLKLLKKNKVKLTDTLDALLSNLEYEFENYQHLSYEVEEIVNKNISDFKYDFPIFNYLDFI